MSGFGSLSLSRRIQINMLRRDMSTDQLAANSGVPLLELRALESGDAVITKRSQLDKIAVALDVPVYELMGQLPQTRTDPRANGLAVEVRIALIERDFLTLLEKSIVDETGPTIHDEDIELAWVAGHSHDFSALVGVLPRLIRDASLAAESVGGPHLDVLSDVYQLASAMMAAVGEGELAWVCADRAIFAAERVRDPHRLAASYFRLGLALLQRGDYDGTIRASRTGAGALNALARSDNTSRALSGALALTRAIAYSRMELKGEALSAISEAETFVAQVDNRINVAHTEFSKANVILHEIAVYVELGDAKMALKAAERHDNLPLSVERRSRYYIDVARAYFQLRDYRGMENALAAAYSLSPQGVTENWFIREIFAYTLRTGVALTPELERLRAATLKSEK